MARTYKREKQQQPQQKPKRSLPDFDPVEEAKNYLLGQGIDPSQV